MPRAKRVGIVGSGFISATLAKLLRALDDLTVSAVLTRRDLDECASQYPGGFELTDSLQKLIDHSDLVVECSGDAIHATTAISAVLDAQLPVVTMNSEFHVTCGSHFADNPLLTEADGDQPGCTAALREDVLAMGFKPLVYGNMKGYLNHNPTPEDMRFWADKQTYSVAQTTSFTDGTKLQIEQAFCANAFGSGIAQDGLIGERADVFEQGALALAARAADLGHAISDYVIAPGQPGGVFICAAHDSDAVGQMMANIKMGAGPHYVFMRPYHLCAVEIPKTIRRMLGGGSPLMTNSVSPTIGVATVAKRALKAGEVIASGIGGFDVRGVAVRLNAHPDHVPIGLVKSATMRRDVAAGEALRLDDIALPECQAAEIALGLVKRAAA